MLEPILEPDLPIVDPHHHLWLWKEEVVAMLDPANPLTNLLKKRGRYMVEELLEDVGCGHNVVATYYAQNHFMYAADGPEHLRAVGEVEYANGMGAIGRSGVYGPVRICDAIIAGVEFGLHGNSEEVLEAIVRVGNGRVRAVRSNTAYTDDPELLGGYVNPPRGLLNSDNFKSDARLLLKHGLALDVWLLEPQLEEMIEFARAMPDLTIVLDHCGSPVGRASYAGTLDERFPIWRRNIQAIAESPNVFVKLGGLGMPTCGFPLFDQATPANSEQTAQAWAPYIETCIEAFGPKRAMFESNFPVDSWAVDYRTLWNAFKRIAAGASSEDKAELFSGTARRVYEHA